MEKFFCREKITKGKPRFSAERAVNWDQKPRIFCMETIESNELDRIPLFTKIIQEFVPTIQTGLPINYAR